MAEDWQVGDLALCVNAEKAHWIYGNGGIKRGAVYNVVAVGSGFNPRFGYGSLFLKEISDGNPLGYASARFRKIKPLTDEEHEQFFAELNVREVV